MRSSTRKYNDTKSSRLRAFTTLLSCSIAGFVSSQLSGVQPTAPAVEANPRGLARRPAPVAALACDLPAVVPGAPLLEEPGQPRVHRDVRVGGDAGDLQADKVLSQGAETRIQRRQPRRGLLQSRQDLVHQLRIGVG